MHPREPRISIPGCLPACAVRRGCKKYNNTHASIVTNVRASVRRPASCGEWKYSHGGHNGNGVFVTAAKETQAQLPSNSRGRSEARNTKEEGRRGKFGFCLAKKVRALPQVLFLSNREFLQHDFPKQNDVETTKTVPFFFLNVNAQCTDKWIEKRTPASPSFLPSIDDCGCDCDCDPGDDLFGKRDEIVPVGRSGPRPIVETRELAVSFLGCFLWRGAFCSVPRLLFSLFPINFGLGLRKAIHSIHFWTDAATFSSLLEPQFPEQNKRAADVITMSGAIKAVIALSRSLGRSVGRVIIVSPPSNPR